MRDGCSFFQSRLHHLINVVHCVEKIEKILQADPKSPDMEIFMNENRFEIPFSAFKHSIMILQEIIARF